MNKSAATRPGSYSVEHLVERRERLPAPGIATAEYITGVVLPIDGGWSLGGATTAWAAINPR